MSIADTAPEPLTFTVHEDVPVDEGRLVDEGLGSYNDEAAPLHEVRRLSCFARRPDGEVVGGAVGRTWGSCCELQQLWVAPDARRRGIGARLVREFERKASSRGCNVFYLETFSFQAPSLYRALGYKAELTLRGFPGGIAKYTMVRSADGYDPHTPGGGNSRLGTALRREQRPPHPRRGRNSRLGTALRRE
jgi:GNAT superfamily N-acetyltransferase